MGAHDFKHNKVPLFARKPGNVNVLRYAAPKLALVPRGRYNCDVNNSFLNAPELALVPANRYDCDI